MRIPMLRELGKRGFVVSAIGSEDGRAFAGHEIPYIRYSVNRWINPFSDLRAVLQLQGVFKSIRPDIVHAFTTKPCILAPFAVALSGTPICIRTLTGMGHVFSTSSASAILLRGAYKQLQKCASKHSTVTIFQNTDDWDYFVTNGMVSRAQSCLVPGSGIDVDSFIGQVPPDDEIEALRKELGLAGCTVVTMVSRIVKTKGIELYLELARRFESRRDMKFLLVGPLDSEGPFAVPLEKIARASSSLIYLGYRADVPAILALTNLFVYPSYYGEGIPRILLEAGALGIPLLASDIPGCREVVKPGWNGYLVKPRKLQALVEGLDRLLAERGEWGTMGQKSSSFVRTAFGLNRIVDAYEEIYRSCLTNRSNS